jgi:hypothetical protein
MRRVLASRCASSEPGFARALRRRQFSRDENIAFRDSMKHLALRPRSALCLALVCGLATSAAAQIPTPTNTSPANASQANTPQANSAQGNAPSAAQDASKFLRYVRAGDQGAHARNVCDKQGLEVIAVPAGGVLAVHRERAGWYEVEVPGGFPVWVWGQYLATTSDPNVLVVTGSNVNMRPLPSNDASNMPMGQLLEKNDKVRLIGRKDASKPLSEDWVNVWSKSGTRAWVAAGETSALPNEADGAALWAKAVTDARPTVGKADAAEATKAAQQAEALKPQSGDVTAALAAADAALAAERKAEQEGLAPDYAKPRALFEKALALAGTGAAADVARDRIKLCTVYSESYALRTEMERKRDTVDAAVKKLDGDMERARSRGAFEGRYEARGWLERRVLPGNQPIYIARWAGDPNAELVCTSGRYDLAQYLDFEIGINGREVRGPVSATNPNLARPRQLDVTRIEVLAGREAKH